ncbi:MAG: hypothetical protein NTZ96_01370 [Burkholderiales bacterium]|nr:hypothetical protein [Burkholderiales bacterium]
MKIQRALVLTVPLLLTACATDGGAPQKTSLEIQSFQSKQFEADKKTAFNSTMSVFQDLGYVVNSASLETGFITAVKGADGMQAFLENISNMRSEGKTAVTAFVEEINGKTTKVRLSFVQRDKMLREYGQQANREKPILDPKVYESAFNKIGDAIFIRTSQK